MEQIKLIKLPQYFFFHKFEEKDSPLLLSRRHLRLSVKFGLVTTVDQPASSSPSFGHLLFHRPQTKSSNKKLSQKARKSRKQESSPEDEDDDDEDDEDEDDEEKEEDDDDDDEEGTPKRQTRRRGATKVKRFFLFCFL